MVVIRDTGPDDVTEVTQALMQDVARSRHYSSWWVTKPIFMKRFTGKSRYYCKSPADTGNVRPDD